MRTRSPILASPTSSCAMYFFTAADTSSCRAGAGCSTAPHTTIVFSILSLTTVPSRTLRPPQYSRNVRHACAPVLLGQLTLSLDRLQPGDRVRCTRGISRWFASCSVSFWRRSDEEPAVATRPAPSAGRRRRACGYRPILCLGLLCHASLLLASGSASVIGSLCAARRIASRASSSLHA